MNWHYKKTPKPCHVGMHWIALVGYSQMSTNLSGFLSGFRLFALMAKLATTSIRVNCHLIFLHARLCFSDHPLLFSARFGLALVAFFGGVCTYAIRTNMSVAMVCMVNHTAILPPDKVNTTRAPNTGEVN